MEKEDWVCYLCKVKILKKYGANALFAIIILVILFVPDAKAFLIRGLMEVGLYHPKIEQPAQPAQDLTGIQFEDIKGNIVDLGDLKGKIIFLNFWATWCPPCRAEMPSIAKLYNQFKDDKDIVFIFADADGNLEKSTKFMSSRKYLMPVFKVNSNIPEQIFSGSLPTTVVFDKQGRLSFKHEGVADYNDKKFIAFLNKLKAQQ